MAQAQPPDFTALRVGGAIVGAGAIGLGALAGVLFAQLPQVERDGSGNVFLEDATKVTLLRTGQGAAATALTAACGFALVSALMLFARPGAPVSVALVASPQGGLLSLGGRF